MCVCEKPTNFSKLCELYKYDINKDNLIQELHQ